MDWELDFTVKANTDAIIKKYTDAQKSRKNFNADEQIRTLEVMQPLQKDNTTTLIDVLLLLIQATFSHSKSMPNGYLIKGVWSKTCDMINQLIDLLDKQDDDQVKESAKAETNDEDDYDKYDKKMKNQLILLTIVGILE